MFILLCVFVALVRGGVLPGSEPLKGVCILGQSETIKGNIYLTEEPGQPITISGSIEGLPAGLHGFHVHQYGDLTNGCASTGGHYNSFGKVHGGKYASIRHVGDLGNIEVESGSYDLFMSDHKVKLSGEHSVYGRAIVIHAQGDDMGRGGDEGSLKTGNAGSRLACCIISVMKT